MSGKRQFKKAKRELYYILGSLTAAAIAGAPLPFCKWFFSALAKNLGWIVPRTIRRADEHLKIAFGDEFSARERKRVIKRMLGNIGKNFAEYMHLAHFSGERIKRMVRLDETFENLARAREMGKGVIAVSGHIGNWEMLGAFTATYMPTTVVARKIYFDKFDAWVNRVRAKAGVNVVYQQKNPRPLLRALRDGHLVGILADQDIESIAGVFVDFFGRPAYTPTAPAVLAMKTGAPLVFYCLYREGNHHRLYVEGPFELCDTGDYHADVLANTAIWTGAVERFIRSHPEQWPWFHRRWKTRKDKSK